MDRLGAVRSVNYCATWHGYLVIKAAATLPHASGSSAAGMTIARSHLSQEREDQQQRNQGVRAGNRDA